MRFYETDEAFIELQEGELCPHDYEEQEISFWQGHGSTIEFKQFNLTIKFWMDGTPYTYIPDPYLMTFKYKGLGFYPLKDEVDKTASSILQFLNSLKKGNVDLIITELIKKSISINPAYVINSTIGHIEQLQKENQELRGKLNGVRNLVNE